MICCAVHAAVGWSVIARWTTRRRLVREQHKDEQHASGEGRVREEVRRDHGCCVIGQERSPCLGGRTTTSLEQSRHGPLRDLAAQFIQAAVYRISGRDKAVALWGAPRIHGGLRKLVWTSSSGPTGGGAMWTLRRQPVQRDSGGAVSVRLRSVRGPPWHLRVIVRRALSVDCRFCAHRNLNGLPNQWPQSTGRQTQNHH
jgi:hypothetical protein